VGAVEDMQRCAREFFAAFARKNNNSVLQAIPGAERLYATRINFQHFSDGLVIYVPLRENRRYSQASGVFGALGPCGCLCLLGLAKQRPVRIGVSISVAAKLHGSGIYGKAVADAYNAESTIARYSRVVATNSVIEYLDALVSYPCDDADILRKVDAAISEECRLLLAKDFDGYAIVDYLGDRFERLLAEKHAQIAGNAFGYLQEQLDEHQRNQNSGLAMRYSLLHGYFSDWDRRKRVEI